MISRPTVYNLKPLQIDAINSSENSRCLQSKRQISAIHCSYTYTTVMGANAPRLLHARLAGVHPVRIL